MLGRAKRLGSGVVVDGVVGGAGRVGKVDLAGRMGHAGLRVLDVRVVKM